MVAVQTDGCAPIVRAFDRGERFAELFAGAATIASGIRVPAAVGDFMILDAVRASRGRAVAVAAKRASASGWAWACKAKGWPSAPRRPPASAPWKACAAEKWISPNEQVVIFNTGAAQKYPEAMQVDLPRLDDPSHVDWDRVAAGTW